MIKRLINGYWKITLKKKKTGKVTNKIQVILNGNKKENAAIRKKEACLRECTKRERWNISRHQPEQEGLYPQKLLQLSLSRNHSLIRGH